MPVRAVLFDYGNVLVRWDPRHLYRKIFVDPAEMERFLSEVVTMDWHIQNDAGALMADTLPPLIAKYPHYEDEIRAWDTRYTETISGEIAESVALLDRLAANGVKLAMITNMPSDQRDACLRHCSRLSLFSAIIVSGVEKISKPDARIYHLALERLGGVRPEEALFIDDSAKNVAGAIAAGLKAHHFTTPAALADALAAEGVLG
jgi:2-haloacid dehalogenase/putative hydrolase of the HAD superfamily